MDACTMELLVDGSLGHAQWQRPRQREKGVAHTTEAPVPVVGERPEWVRPWTTENNKPAR